MESKAPSKISVMQNVHSKSQYSPDQHDLVDWTLSLKAKIRRFNSQSGHTAAWVASQVPGWGHVKRQSIDVLSLIHI